MTPPANRILGYKVAFIMSEKEKQNPGKSKNRRKSRELALQTLYACEVGAAAEWEVMLDRIADDACAASDTVQYARELVRKAFDAMARLDETIAGHAANWELKRMAAIDRNILRLAVTELLFFGDVPFKVVIDEAVELAKRYGADESGRFVNGILDSIHKEQLSQEE